MLGRGKESPKPKYPAPSHRWTGAERDRASPVKALRSREQWLEGEGKAPWGGQE